ARDACGATTRPPPGAPPRGAGWSRERPGRVSERGPGGRGRRAFSARGPPRGTSREARISTGARPCWSQAGPGSPPGRHTTWGGSVSTLLISVSCLRWADPADGLAEAGEVGRVECREGV